MATSIVVSNLPSSCTPYEVNVLFGEIGEVKRSFILKNEVGRQVKLQFRDTDDHEKALKKFNKYSYKDHTIAVKVCSDGDNTYKKPVVEDLPIISKKKKSKKRSNPFADLVDEENKSVDSSNEAEKPPKKKKKKSEEGIENSNKEASPPKKKKKKVDENGEEIPFRVFFKDAKKKILEEGGEASRYHKPQIGRVIVRNFPFQADEDYVRNYFGKFGAISEVNFPRRRNAGDKDKKGCVFIQFGTEEEAVKAIKGTNLKILMGRPISVDHAVPKGRFIDPLPLKEVKEEEEIKQEEDETKKEAEKEEAEEEKPDADTVTLDNTVVEKPETSDEEDEGEEDKDNILLDKSEIKKEPMFRVDPKTYKHNEVSKDVQEGRTVFISGLSVDTSQLSLESVLTQFGELKYVMLVIDKKMEQPKGTAFAQFKTKEAAEACLEASDDITQHDKITVDGKVMKVKKAVGRSDCKSSFEGSKVTKVKDKRNMYLAKEGFIREGTQAASGVSKSDIFLRREREKVKQKLLSNLHNFVSPTRLCVNNLPPTMDDAGLREVFSMHMPGKKVILECRVMRYLQDIDDNGMAKSRCYGFVSFRKHEQALSALRTINNNPDVFTPFRRPIVEFSIENKAVLNAKANRLKNSRKQNKKTTENLTVQKEVTSTERPDFAGMTSKKGDVKGNKIHKHLGPKIRRRDVMSGKKKPNLKKKVKKTTGKPVAKVSKGKKK